MKSEDIINEKQIEVKHIGLDPEANQIISNEPEFRFYQETHKSPYDCETLPIEVNTKGWLENTAGVNTGYLDAFFLMLDKIENASTKSTDDDFIPCRECHFAASRHADDCMAAAAGDFELMGKQHMLINGFKCQLGCDEYATEKKLGVFIDGFPVTLLVCEACAFGGVDE